MTMEPKNSEVIEPSNVSQIRRRKAATDTPTKVGMSNTIDKVTAKLDMMIKALNRKMRLTIPTEIINAHPDKYFVWVNMNRLEKSGMWHHNGYELFKTNEHLTEDVRDKFNKGVDNYIHRNEMVLAYLPRKEYELRKKEWEILHGNRDISEIITLDPNLRGFSPKADLEKGFVSSSEEGT